MMNSTIRPLGNRVLVKRIQPKTSKGGILLPESAQEKPKEAEIIAVGPGKIKEDGTLHSLEVKKGDRILFSSYAGIQVHTEDKESEYLILSEEEILGILV